MKHKEKLFYILFFESLQSFCLMCILPLSRNNVKKVHRINRIEYKMKEYTTKQFSSYLCALFSDKIFSFSLCPFSLQLSQDIGYVLYSALGSFYIPSCIMVFVYIRIYFAAKRRARRGIKKQPRKPPNEQVS